MKFRSYKSRFYISICAVFIMMSVILCLISYYVSRNIIITSAADTKYRQLKVISGQIDYSYKKAHELLQSMTLDNDLVNTVHSINNYRLNSDIVQNVKKIQNIIITKKMANIYFEKIYIVSSKYILSENGVVTDFLPKSGSGNKNPYITKLESDEQFRQYILSNNQGVYEDGILIVHIDPSSFIVGILDIERIIGKKDDRLLFIFDHSDHLVYHDALAPVHLKDSYENVGAFLSSQKSITVGGKEYLPVSFVQDASRYRYSMLVDINAFSKALVAPVKRLVFFVFVVCAATVLLLYFIASFLVRPITRLDKVVAGMEDSSDEGKLNHFISYMKKRNKLRNNLYLSSCFILIPLTVIISVSYLIFKDVVVEEVKLTYSQEVRQVGESMEKRVENYISLSKQISFDETLADKLKLAGQDTANYQDRENSIRTMFWDILFRNGILSWDTTFVRLYDRNGEMCYSTNMGHDIEKLGQDVIERLSAPYNYSMFSISEEDEEEGSLYFTIRNLKASSESRLFDVLGYLELGVTDFFNKGMDASELSPYSTRYIYDQKTWRLIDTMQNTAEKQIVEGMAQGGLIQTGIPKVIKLENKNRMVASHLLKGTDWMLIYVIPLNNLMKENLKILYYDLYSLGGLLIVIFILSGGFTASMLKPISRLQRYFGIATINSMDLPMPENMENEIGLLAHSFRDLLRRINGLTELIREKEKERLELEFRKNEAEIIALQAQMNPHFMSNIFTSMKILQKSRKSEELFHMLDAASNFLRSNLLCGEYDIPLSKEIAHAEAYLEIQRIRYAGKFEVNWHFEEAVVDNKVPKYLLQPILENAIVHGMKSDKVLHISIRIQEDEQAGVLGITILDDGTGIMRERLEQIRGLLAESKPSDRIGLLNINERIKLHYGSPFGIEVDSEYGGFTCVSIRMPVQKGGDPSFTV